MDQRLLLMFFLPVFFYIVDSFFLWQRKFIHDISDCICLTNIKIPAGPYSRTNVFKDAFPSDSILKHDRSASDMAENFLRIIDDFSACH